MKKFFYLFPLLLAPMLAGCEAVPPGHAGIRVSTLGADRGIEEKPLGVGWYWLGFWQKLYTYPIFAQTYVWSQSQHEGRKYDESITFQDMDGTSINADVGIQYTIQQDKVPQLFIKYRKTTDEITHVVMRNAVRDALLKEGAKFHVTDIYGAKKADLMKSVETLVRSEFTNVGITLDSLYWVSDVRLPETIRSALNAKIQASQIAEQKKTELLQSEADAQKVIAAAEGEKQAAIKKAEGIAERNKLITQSLTPALVQYEMATRWNGIMPQVQSGNGAGVMLQLPMPASDHQK